MLALYVVAQPWAVLYIGYRLQRPQLKPAGRKLKAKVLPELVPVPIYISLENFQAPEKNDTVLTTKLQFLKL